MLGLLPGLRQQAHDRLMVAISVLGVCVAAMYAPVVENLLRTAARLVATQGSRIEPVTDQVALTCFEREMTQFKYAILGLIPDGYMVRVSSISADVAHAYVKQTEFAESLLSHINGDLRKRLIGRS